MEVGADAILIDDRPARRAAEAAGLNAIGTLGLLLQAQRAGHIETLRAELDRLLATSFFLSQALYDELLPMAGELKRDHTLRMLLRRTGVLNLKSGSPDGCAVRP
jgi:uncharacterized protein